MDKWEYMMIGVTIPADLSRMNNLGEDGWEVISVVLYEHREFKVFLKRRKK
jgi:hypothetical protein